MRNRIKVKVYHGYGHSQNLIVYGHVLKNESEPRQQYTNNLFSNILFFIRTYSLKPYPLVKVILTFRDQQVESITERDGFFKFEWSADAPVDPGLHAVSVVAVGKDGAELAAQTGKVFVPERTQYGVISDVDDTVLVSHSTKPGLRVRELLIKNPHTRKMFEEVQHHYSLLALAQTTPDLPNPFFYVSNSEWNLYDYLKEAFRHNHLPEGIFLLNSIRRWGNIFSSNTIGYEGKLLRVMRIIDAFPNQKFIFLGDNSQQDPAVYATIAAKYADNFAAVYIRNIDRGKSESTKRILNQLEKQHIPVCLYNKSAEAIEHSKQIGLI